MSFQCPLDNNLYENPSEIKQYPVNEIIEEMLQKNLN